MFTHRHPLVVGGCSDGELEVDTLARQPLVDLAVSVESVVNTTPLLLIQHNLEDLASILTCPYTLANNLDRVDKVGEDSVVNGGERARTRTLLGLCRTATVGALGAGENAARCNDQDVAVRELLLELAGQAEQPSVCHTNRTCERENNDDIPLLRPVPSLQKRNGDEDDNRLSARANLDLEESWCQHHCAAQCPSASSCVSKCS